MDIAGFFATVNLVDLLIFAYLFGWFVLGYAQGAIRRIVGILTISFSFFLAAQLSVPLGSWLASHWRQFPPGYAEMIGFGALFVAGVIAFALIVQGTYTRVAVFAEHPIVDEILGRRPGRDRGRPAADVRRHHPRRVLPHRELDGRPLRAAPAARDLDRRSTGRGPARSCTRPSSRPS